MPLPNRAAATLSLLALAGLAACGPREPAPVTPEDRATPSTSAGIWAGNVTAEPIAGGVRLGNNTTRQVGYFLIEKEFAMVANWRPCVPPASCPTLAPGERRAITGEDVVGLKNGRGEVIVHWWHYTTGRDGRVSPDSIRASTVRVGS
jgi:hypothetical protein